MRISSHNRNRGYKIIITEFITTSTAIKPQTQSQPWFSDILQSICH